MDTLLDAIEIFIPGDWGNEEYSQDAPNEVICIRGADIENVKCGIYQNIPIRYVSNTSFNKKTLESGDIIIEKSGGSPTQSTGRVCYISDELIESKKNVVCSNFCAAFRMKSKWYYKYIYYYLHNIYSQGNFFNYEGKTSGIRNLLLETAFQAITLPDILTDVQKRTVKILDKIDQKINLNTRMNAELEAMAKQLYDYWFIQFDFPDENGKPYKSSGGKMLYNEKIKREIPEGWDVKLLEEILSLLRDGTHNPPKRVESGIPLLTGTMFGNYFIDHSLATYITEVDYNNIHKQYKPQSGDIILTKIGTIGNVNYLRNKDIPLAIHCNSALLRFPSSMGKSFPFFLCKSQLFTLRLKAMKGQSVQEFVSLDKIGSVRMEIPNNELISLFNQKVDKIFDEITNLSEEIESLSHLRDSLLPMLMNGQVTVE